MTALLQSSILAVFFWLALGGLGIPLPEDAALLATGVLIERGLVHWYVALPIVVIGVLGGDAALFYVARKLGPRAYEHRMIKRVLPPDRRAKIENAYHRYGGRLVFLARHVAGLRGAAFAMAGMSGMQPWRFLLWDGLAACISIPFVVSLGFFGSRHIARMRAGIAHVHHYVLLAVALAVLGYVTYRHVRQLRGARSA